MKYLILIAIIFTSFSCVAQKANFAALNRINRGLLVIYNTTSVSSTCIAPVGAKTNLYITEFPVIGSTCYTTAYGGVKFVGNGDWYFSDTWATCYQINSSGVIINIFSC